MLLALHRQRSSHGSCVCVCVCVGGEAGSTRPELQSQHNLPLGFSPSIPTHPPHPHPLAKTQLFSAFRSFLSPRGSHLAVWSIMLLPSVASMVQVWNFGWKAPAAFWSNPESLPLPLGSSGFLHQGTRRSYGIPTIHQSINQRPKGLTSGLPM